MGKEELAIEYEAETDEIVLRFAVEVIKQAGKYVREVIGQAAIETHWKSDNTPTTNLDTTINSLFIQKLSEKYPYDRIYGEEESGEERPEAKYTWVIDPIDGTQAIGKLDTFTICVSRLGEDGQPVLSLVYNPIRDELYTAMQGEQSFLNGQPLHVSDKVTVKSSYVHFGSGLSFDGLVTNGVAYDRLEGQGAKIFNTRSLAHGCVEVAKGEFEAAFIAVRTPFEAAAVVLIVEGAGGHVTDLYGGKPGRLHGEILGMIVSNGHIHQALIDALQP